MNVELLNEVGLRVERRNLLIKEIKKKHPKKNGALLFCSAFESSREVFDQDSTFDYFVGLQDSGLVLFQDINDQPILFTPDYSEGRNAWLPARYDEEYLAKLAIQNVKKMGDTINNYLIKPFFEKKVVNLLINYLVDYCNQGNYLFISYHTSSDFSRLFLQQILAYAPELSKKIITIDSSITALRRSKSEQEMEHLYLAAEVTALAHEAAAGVIKAESLEQDVQAAIEFIFTESGAQKAYPTIVGSGKNGVVLHYNDNKDIMHSNQLVVVDAGARVNHYCCDVTRTYPVSGRFTAMQKKIYQDVLDCQTYIVSLLRPGMYLNNKQYPEKCLNILAHNFLAKRGYDVSKSFPHSIGHFIGLDCHDVGDYSEPLSVDDVITIEPGIYLQDQSCGVRIEDVYWIVKDGSVCLTDQIPKKVDEVEKIMQISQSHNFKENEITGPDEH